MNRAGTGCLRLYLVYEIADQSDGPSVQKGSHKTVAECFLKNQFNERVNASHFLMIRKQGISIGAKIALESPWFDLGGV